MYSDLLTYGDFIQLKNSCNSKELLEEIKDFEWKQYNPRKNVNRYGLSITSNDGSLNGEDLDSLYEYSKEKGRICDEDEFTTLTDVNYKSKEVQKLVNPFKPWLCRTHFLNFRRGGYFPPHRDHSKGIQNTFRLIVPIQNFNPPFCRFILEDTTLYWEQNKMYFLNTTKHHTLFNASPKRDSIWLIINAKLCKETIDFVIDNLDQK